MAQEGVNLAFGSYGVGMLLEHARVILETRSLSGPSIYLSVKCW